MKNHMDTKKMTQGIPLPGGTDWLPAACRLPTAVCRLLIADPKPLGSANESYA